MWGGSVFLTDEVELKMRYYLLRDPGWHIEAVGDFPSEEEAHAAMVGDRVPDDWKELLENDHYWGRYYVRTHGELVKSVASAVKNDPGLLPLIHNGLMEDFTDEEARMLFYMSKEDPCLKLSQAVTAVRMKTRFWTPRLGHDAGPSPALVGSD
jgi:hypothetical protein